MYSGVVGSSLKNSPFLPLDKAQRSSHDIPQLRYTVMFVKYASSLKAFFN